MGTFVFLWQRDTGGERVAMATKLRVWYCSFFDAHLWCQVSRTLILVFPEISFIQYFTILKLQILWRHHWSNLHNRKMSISLKRKTTFQKEKRHSSVFRKAFQLQISRKKFSCHLLFPEFNKCLWDEFIWKLWLFLSFSLVDTDKWKDEASQYPAQN